MDKLRLSAIIFIFMLLSASYFAENIIIIEYGEKGIGESCSNNYECSTWLCLNGVCSSCSSNADCSETTSYCFNGKCTPCSLHSDCDSLLCDNGICKKCYKNEDCSISTGLCNVSSNKCKLCTSGSECPSGFCDAGYCRPCTSDGQCEKGICSLGNCKLCTEIGCKNAWKCNPSNGKCYCKDLGETCESDIECCSGRCAGGRCASIVIEKGERRPPSYTGEGAGASGAEEGKLKVVIEREVKASSGFLVDILGIGRKRIEMSTICFRGAVCSSDEGCCGAPCVDGYCLCSTAFCRTSGECCSGYCDYKEGETAGVCRSAPTITLFSSEILKRPITEIGCAGLVEGCFGEGTCISFCNTLSALVALISVGGMGISFKRFKNPIVAFISLIIPIGAGLLLYPFVGIIIGILLILFYSFVK
jgi:hypothetical protein